MGGRTTASEQRGLTGMSRKVEGRRRGGIPSNVGSSKSIIIPSQLNPSFFPLPLSLSRRTGGCSASINTFFFFLPTAVWSIFPPNSGTWIWVKACRRRVRPGQGVCRERDFQGSSQKSATGNQTHRTDWLHSLQNHYGPKPHCYN